MSLTLLGCGGPKPAASAGPPQLVASSANVSGTTTTTPATTVDIPSGTLFVYVSFDTGTPSVSDSLGGTWTARATDSSGFVGNHGFAWFSKAVSVDHPIGTTFTASVTSSAAFLTAIAIWMPGTTAFDTNINATAASPLGTPNPAVVSASPSVAGEYALASVMGQNGYSGATDDATWTLLIDDGFRNHVLYKQAAGTGGFSYSESLNTSNWGLGLVAAK